MTDTNRSNENGEEDGVSEAQRLVMGDGWSDPSEKARTVGLTRREFIEETGLKSLGAAGAAAGLASGATGCLGDDGLNVGYIPITDSSPLLTAYLNGHWEEYGLEVNRPRLFRGWDELAEAFFSGDLDVAHFLMPMTFWMRYAEDFDAKVVAWDHTDGSGITVHDGIDGWEDLGGGQVAVPFWYSIHNVVLQISLREAGLTPRTDTTDVDDDEVSLVVMPPPDMPAALSEGNIDGYIVAEPFNAVGELEAGGNMLRFTGDIWREHACCVVTMRESAIEANPEWAQNVMNGVVDAQVWLRDNLEEAPELLSEQAGDDGLLPQSVEAIDRAMNYYDETEYGTEQGNGAIRHPEWESRRIGFYPYPYPSYTEELHLRLRETDVDGPAQFLEDLSPEEAADDLVEYEYVRNALEDVGGPEVFGEHHGYERDETIEF